MQLLCVTTDDGQALVLVLIFFNLFSCGLLMDPKRLLLREKGAKRIEKIDMWGCEERAYFLIVYVQKIMVVLGFL